MGLRRSFFKLLVHDAAHDLLEHGEIAAGALREVALDALLNVLADDINLHVNLIAGVLGRCDDLFLRVRDQHHLPISVSFLSLIDDFGHGQARAVQRHIALLHDIAQNTLVARPQTKRQRIPVRRLRHNSRGGVDMALHKMTAHPRIRRHRPLEIDSIILLQRAEVRAAQCLRRDADLEPVLVEGGDGKAGSCRNPVNAMSALG